MAQNGLMGAELPKIGRQEFVGRLHDCSPGVLTEAQAERLFLHYSELRRWNTSVSLVGPVAANELVERHYGESLAALPFLPERQGVLVDLGTGAGFPGFVLAAVRDSLAVTLVESRGRKWSFLKSVCRSAALSCNCLNARVGSSPAGGLPQRIDWITARAVRFDGLGLSVLLPRLVERGSLLLWSGVESPELPESLQLNRQISLVGSKNRRILELVRKDHRRDPL